MVAAAIAPGVVALGICCYQLSLPHILLGTTFGGNGPDDGVYLGVATRMVHGVLPYRDFDFLHPPGLPLLISPLTLLGRLIGTRDALVLARCLTALVAGLNSALAALVVRHRGTPTMAVAGFLMATYPLAVTADVSLLLEPYLVCFCLLGAVLLFRHGELASPGRIAWAGAALGFAGAIKVWAVFPAIAAVAVCVPLWRRAVRPLLVGVLLGFGIPVLPFFLAAPRAMLHDVISAQLGRSSTPIYALSIAQRLEKITGLSALPNLHATTGQAIALSIALAVVVVVVYTITGRRTSRVEWFAVAAVATVLTCMFLSPEFYDHYAYFPAAFGAVLLALCAGRIYDAAIHLLARWRPGGRTVWRAGVTLAVVLGAGGVLLVQQGTSFASNFLASSNDPSARVDATIPAGACVVTDYTTLLVDSNRFDPASPGCPALVDPFGMWITRDHGHPPPTPPPFPASFVAVWQQAFERADYVVLSVPLSDYIPWTLALDRYFEANYVLVSSQPHTYVYDHYTRHRLRKPRRG